MPPSAARRFPHADVMAELYGYMPAFLREKLERASYFMNGERQAVAVLFAKIGSDTAVFQVIGSEEAFGIMKNALRLLASEVYRYEGFVNQFTGDGIMAIFGAPLVHEDDSERAVWAALGMQAALREFTGRLSQRYGLGVGMRIALSYGEAMVGGIGSDRRMDYTAVGDVVNLASRLRETAALGEILVSQDIYERTQHRFEFRERGALNLRGIADPVSSYEVVGPRTSSSDEVGGRA